MKKKEFQAEALSEVGAGTGFEARYIESPLFANAHIVVKSKVSCWQQVQFFEAPN
jgi:hypothetical protein